MSRQKLVPSLLVVLALSDPEHACPAQCLDSGRRTRWRRSLCRMASLMTSIVPAIYLTYRGTDAEILDLIREVSVDGRQN